MLEIQQNKFFIALISKPHLLNVSYEFNEILFGLKNVWNYMEEALEMDRWYGKNESKMDTKV